MEPEAGPVLYQKLRVWEPSLESEEEEEEISEQLILDASGPHDSSGNKAGRLPGAWAQLVAALLLLAVGFSLAVRQLYSSGASPGALGSGAPPASGHSHRPGVYHHGAIISPAGQCEDCCSPQEQCPGHRGQQRLRPPSHLLAQQLLRLWTPVPKHRSSTQQPGG
nr:PREDICTED: gamma-glutamyltransferase 6 isoform X4 [Bos mutus]